MTGHGLVPLYPFQFAGNETARPCTQSLKPAKPFQSQLLGNFSPAVQYQCAGSCYQLEDMGQVGYENCRHCIWIVLICVLMFWGILAVLHPILVCANTRFRELTSIIRMVSPQKENLPIKVAPSQMARKST